MYTLAVDIGGTKIAAGMMDEKNHWISKIKQTSDTRNAAAMYESLVGSMHHAVKEASLSLEQIQHIGVAIPGKVNIEEGIAIYQNNLPWRNFALGKALREAFPNRAITFEHDVAAAALGEWAARKVSKALFVYITISTGIAASTIHNGVPLRGMGLAGEIGFFPVSSTQDLEGFASGSAMEEEIRVRHADMTLEQAFTRWNEGDKEFADFFDEKAYQLALAIINVTAMLDPNQIVLGGGVVNNQQRFFQRIKDHYQAQCTHPVQQDWPARIEKSMLLGESGLFGVAMKAKNNAFINTNPIN